MSLPPAPVPCSLRRRPVRADTVAVRCCCHGNRAVLNVRSSCEPVWKCHPRWAAPWYTDSFGHHRCCAGSCTARACDLLESRGASMRRGVDRWFRRWRACCWAGA